MFAVVDRGTARTPWEFSLGFGSSGATGALFAKTRNNRVVSIPSFAHPRASRLDVSRLEARVGVAPCRAMRSPSFARVRAETIPHAPRARLDATRDD